MVKTVFILGKELFKGATAVGREHLVDFALCDSVLVTTVSMN